MKKRKSMAFGLQVRYFLLRLQAFAFFCFCSLMREPLFCQSLEQAARLRFPQRRD